jgi:ribosomal protein S13
MSLDEIDEQIAEDIERLIDRKVKEVLSGGDYEAQVQTDFAKRRLVRTLKSVRHASLRRATPGRFSGQRVVRTGSGVEHFPDHSPPR